ncbi:hypothetical protein AB0I27_22790 [Streptomyces sp. NPDC050597]|uniref:hypothetical protein n=1 Tax=Streptomyces sp. NPDC050597 TaxID=3157212 RepID=UPI00342B6C0A
MGAVPNSSKLRWQRDAHKALGGLLKLNDLPVIAWRIPVSGVLVGDVDSLTSTPAEMRAAFVAWAQRLDAVVVPERAAVDGVTHLYAKFRLDVGFGVGGALRATIYQPMDDDGGAR